MKREGNDEKAWSSIHLSIGPSILESEKSGQGIARQGKSGDSDIWEVGYRVGKAPVRGLYRHCDEKLGSTWLTPGFCTNRQWLPCAGSAGGGFVLPSRQLHWQFPE